MSKTLVVARHLGGPLPNGAYECYTRWPHGFCSGVRVAKWLNELGEDGEPYGPNPIHQADAHIITNREIRAMWLSSSDHIKQLEGVEASFVTEKQRIFFVPRADQSQSRRLSKTSAAAA